MQGRFRNLHWSFAGHEAFSTPTGKAGNDSLGIVCAKSEAAKDSVMKTWTWFAAVAGTLGVLQMGQATPINPNNRRAGGALLSGSVGVGVSSSVPTVVGAAASFAAPRNLVLATHRLSPVIGPAPGSSSLRSGLVPGRGYLPTQTISNPGPQFGRRHAGNGNGNGNNVGSDPPNSVPDGGTAVSLLGIAVVGTALVKRKLDGSTDKTAAANCSRKTASKTPRRP